MMTFGEHILENNNHYRYSSEYLIVPDALDGKLVTTIIKQCQRLIEVKTHSITGY